MSMFAERLAGLSSAEEFLEFLAVPYDATVVRVNRLHILKRFHDYIAAATVPSDASDEVLADTYSRALKRAYADFLTSTPQREKLFKVHRDAMARTGFVSLSSLARRPPVS